MDVDGLVRDGYVAVRGAVAAATVAACRQLIWEGLAGDVFLCHPFIVHTATWPHRGTRPRMMAQPAVHVADGFALDGSDRSPVARAIVEGLADTSQLVPRAVAADELPRSLRSVSAEPIARRTTDQER